MFKGVSNTWLFGCTVTHETTPCCWHLKTLRARENSRDYRLNPFNLASSCRTGRPCDFCLHGSDWSVAKSVGFWKRWNQAHFAASTLTTCGILRRLLTSVSLSFLLSNKDAKWDHRWKGAGPGSGTEQLSSAAIGVIMRAVRRASSVSPCQARVLPPLRRGFF